MARVWQTFVIVSCVCVFLTPGRASAQGVRGGIEGGLAVTGLANLTNAIDFGGPVDVNRRKGLALGAFVAAPMNPSVALRIEALLTTNGATPTDGVNTLKIRLRYVDIPILLDIHPPSAKPIYFLLGPSLNFNVAAKSIQSVSDVQDDVEEDARNKVKNTELGLVIGAGVAIRRAFVEWRLAAGLTDIFDDPSLHAPVKNRSMMLLAGVRF